MILGSTSTADMQMFECVENIMVKLSCLTTLLLKMLYKERFLSSFIDDTFSLIRFFLLEAVRTFYLTMKVTLNIRRRWERGLTDGTLWR